MEHDVIIVHHLPLTREAKIRIATMSVETFFYSELSYDPVSIIDNPYVVYEHPVKEKDKLPKISDVITRLYGFKKGTVIYVKDERTQIPCLYLLI